MTKKLLTHSRRRALCGLVMVIIANLAFQNCGRVSIVSSVTPTVSTVAATVTAPAPAAPALPVISMSQVFVPTTLNHAVSVSVDTGVAGSILSFEQGSTVTTKDLGNGTVTVDQSSKMLTFTPNTGFRGNVAATLYSTYQLVTNIQNITFTVGNPVLGFKPALAVRGPECMLCHASLQGDLVSDFGFKSAGDPGPDLFATADDPKNPWASVYGVAHSGSDSLNTASIVGKLVIPKIDFTQLDPTIVRSWFPLVGPLPAGSALPPSPLKLSPPVTTMANFIKAYEVPSNTGFEGVSEINSVYIGAPTVADVLTASQMTAPAVTQFFKNTSTDPDFSGLTRVQVGNGRIDYYTNSASVPVICEGDYFIDAVVLLDHVNLQTTYGCRIYSTHSVFIQGPITYTNVSALSNLEISSAVGIFMGFGYCFDCANAVDHGYANQNTLMARFGVIKSVGGLNALRTRTFDANVALASADFALTSDTPTTLPPPPPSTVNPLLYYGQYFASQGMKITQLDATNSFMTESKTTYSRLMLNAPIVMSRYSGDFQGIVIAEFAMWRLGAFTFNFDPVFTGVPLLPFLDFSKILNLVQ